MTKLWNLLIVLVIVLGAVTCQQRQSNQVPVARVTSLKDCILYLLRFGYIRDISEVASLLTPPVFPPFQKNSTLSNNPAITALRIALTMFQRYARLPQTGEFDDTTRAKMNKPRCGNKDIIHVPDPNIPLMRRKRFVFSGFKWHKQEVTYRIESFSQTGLISSIVLRDIQRAFRAWENETSLHFVQSQDKNVDIELRFARGSHGDVEPFDGRGIILAHAYPPGPQIGGDVHFDDDEEWTYDVRRGTNFFHVAVHEIGHALGLRHSDEEMAVMYAFVREYDPYFHLHEDDIQGIQSLYGAKGEDIPTTTSSTPQQTSPVTSATSKPTTMGSMKPVTSPWTTPDLCRDGKLDAIFTFAGNQVLAFKGGYVFNLNENGQGVEKRTRVDNMFPGLPPGIDAAVTIKDHAYFFKANKVWRYDNQNHLDPSFPRDINEVFPGIPGDLDAVFTWSGDGLHYFFKGDEYWGFDPLEDPPVAYNYPLPIKQWLGLPDDGGIDAAFQAPNGQTYFFKDESYWLFDDDNFQVAEADPSYPRSSRIMWFGCTSFRPDKGDVKTGWPCTFVNRVSNLVKKKLDFVKNVKGKVDQILF